MRQAYGWDDEQIIDAVEQYGADWLNEVYQFIQEDKQRDLQNLAAVMPLARSPMGKEDAKSLAYYHKHVQKQIEAMTPWKSKHRRSLSDLRKSVKSGQVVVIPDGSDVGNPLYKDADIQKDSS